MPKPVQVIKRDGSSEDINFNKILEKLNRLSIDYEPILDKVDTARVAAKVCAGVYDGVTTKELDSLSAEVAAALTTTEVDYGYLAARIIVSTVHETTSGTVRGYLNSLKETEILSDETVEVLTKYGDELDKVVDHRVDYNYTYFGIQTLLRSYLLRDAKMNVCERPQFMHLRIAVGIHGSNINEIIHTFKRLSLGEFTHASPTMFNAGTRKNQLSSCFLLTTKEDSIKGIFETIQELSLIHI